MSQTTDAVIAELMDRRLLNDVDDSLHQEIAEAIIKAAQPVVDDDEPLTTRDLAMIDQAWENHKSALPVATVINDNQLGRTAIIEITIDPPTLPVGTKLYAEPGMVELPEAAPAEFPTWGAEDEAYELGKRDGYESAIQDLDLATGGDGEFKGSTMPGGTVDVPSMKQRIRSALIATPPAGEVATLTYTNYRGETSVRRIIPKSVRYGSTEWHPEPQWLLLAWDDDKQADREFALKDFAATPPAITERDGRVES